MWKKVLVSILTLVGTFSVVYAVNNELFANTTTFNAGGSITGRVNKAPAGLQLANGNTSIGMQKGDKVLIGEKNPLDNSQLGFQLLEYHQGYTDYGTNISLNMENGIPTCLYGANCLPAPAANNTPLNSWFSLATKSVTNKESYITDMLIPFGNADSPYIWRGGGSNYTIGVDYTYFLIDANKTNYYLNTRDLIENVNNSKDIYKIIEERDLTEIRKATTIANDQDGLHRLLSQDSLKHTLFIPVNADMRGLSIPDMAFLNNYWVAFSIPRNDPNPIQSTVANSMASAYVMTNGNWSNVLIDNGAYATFRPALYLNMDDVVFATSMGTATGLATVSQPKLTSGYTSIYEETKNDQDMKVRVLNPSLTVTLSGLKNTSGSSALKVINGKNEVSINSTVQINANANPWSNSTVSVLVFDVNGNFKYYKPLEAAKGAGDYAFDTTGLPIGEYQIAIVNEVYDNTSAIAADSSALSDVQQLRIVEPLNYTTQNSSATYTYKDNVNAGSNIATVNYSNGAGNPIFSIVTDSASGHGNDYLNFDVLTDTTTSSASIKIKSNGPNLVNGSLKTGEYSFYINGVDGNGNMGTTNQKIVIHVAQAQGTLNITSNTALEDLMLGSTASGTFNTNNTDLNDVVIPVCEISGSMNTLKVTECTSAGKFSVEADILSSNTNLPEEFTLNITIPATENYKASTTVQKKYRVYKELNTLAFAKQSQYTTLQADIGASLGVLSVKDGIPEYTFALTDELVDGDKYVSNQALDNAKFRIGTEAGKPAVIVNEKLSNKRYFIQLKVTDQKSKTLYLPVEIDVVLASQDEIKFKDKIGGNIINDASFTYSSQSPSVFAQGGNGNGAIKYSVAQKQPDGSENPQDVFSVDEDTGSLTLLKVGTSYVTATKSGGSDYSDVSVTIPITITPGPQSIAFDSTTIKKALVSDASYDVHAQVSGREDMSTPSATTYSSLTESICTVSNMGKVTIKTAGKCTIKATNSDANYQVVEDSAEIMIYDDLSAEFVQEMNPVKVGTPSLSAIGVINNKVGGDGQYQFSITSNLLSVNAEGIVSLNKELTIDDIKDKWSIEKQQYIIEESITMRDGENYTTQIPVRIICQGALLNASFNNVDATNTMQETYAPRKQFQLSLNGNLGGGAITYQLKTDTLGVLDSITSGGAVIIAKAGDTPAVVEAVVEPKNGYEGQTISANIKINKATQTIGFDPVLPTSMQFIKDNEVVVSAKGQFVGTVISYEASPSTVCTNINENVTMVGEGDCTITAKGNLENYEEASTSSTIKFYSGVAPAFIQTESLQAKAEDAIINDLEVHVGTIATTGGLHDDIRYAIASNEGDANKAKDIFAINGTGETANLSLKKDIKASELIVHGGVYDSVNDTYLLKVQVDVFDGSDLMVDATVDCVVKIQGASFNPSFTSATNAVITKTYGDGYFDLSLQGNVGDGAVTYAIQSEPDVPTDILTLSATRVFIKNADDKMPTITADIKANAGYEKMQISTKVKINKAELSSFNFSNSDDESILLGSDVTPTFTGTVTGASIELKSGMEAIVVQGNTLSASIIGQSIVSATTPLASDLVAYRNYNQKTVTKKYIVYDALGGNITQSNISMQAKEETATANVLVGRFDYENGNGTVKATISEGDEYFYKTDANTIYLKKDILKEDIIWDATNATYYIPLTITLIDDTATPIELKKKITFIGENIPTLTFKDAVNGKISTTYKLNDRYPLDLVGYWDESGNAQYGAVSYRLKADSTKPSDVVNDIAKIDDVYYVFKGNANAESVTIEAVIEAGNGYQGTVLPCEFEITKAPQAFDFTETALNFKKGTSITPQFSAIPKGNNGEVLLDVVSQEPHAIRVEGTKLIGIATGTSRIQATAKGNENFNDAVVTKEVTVFDDLSFTFTQEPILPQAGTDSAKKDVAIGTINLQGAQEPSITLDETHVDNAYFALSGNVLNIHKDIQASDLASKTWNEDKKAYEMQVEFSYSDKFNTAQTNVQTIYIKGAKSNVSFKDSNGSATTKIEKSYNTAQFSLALKNNIDDTWPYGAITYRLDESSNTTAVLEKIEADGKVYIKNANLLDNPEKVMAIASIAPANGYEGTESTCEIYITKAAQPDFAFRAPIKLELPGEVTPEFQGLLSSEPLNYTIVDQAIATYDKDTNKIVAQSTGVTKVSATTSGNDRNYAVATTPEVELKVQHTENYTLVIKVPEPATYGDTGPLKAIVSIDTSKGSEKQRKWFSDNENVASIDDEGNITIHHAGVAAIHVEQTTNLEPETKTSASLLFTVKQKQLSIQIANKEKYVGQDVPTFSIESIEGLLERDKDSFVEPLYLCQYGNGNPVDAFTAPGKYLIKGFPVKDANKDYYITNDTIQPGELTIKQDMSLPSWYEVTSETQPTKGWYNKPVTLKLVQADGSYDKISDDMKGPWDETIVVSEEGVQEKDVYFKDTITNKIASPQETEIKVDETAPKITSIAGKDTNTSKAAKLLHTLTLKQFYKPGKELVITAEDVVPKEGVIVSDIAKIDYKIYQDVADEEGNTLVKEGSVEDKTAIIVLNEPKDYTVCAIAYDHAGNATNEVCQKATVKKIDVDVDGDEKLDFNDSDDDGCPDLNIKWKDKEGNWVIVNGDRDYDGIPDLNIDGNGDGEIDLNVDTDKDNLPDLNLVILKKSDWIPTKCVTTQVEEYCTGTILKAKINVDIDNETKKEPDLDIDTDGDMKADINISKHGKAAVNIAIHKDWEPNVKYTVDTFMYDTDDALRRYLNIDTSGNGIPDVNVDLNDDGIADLNIDTNGDEIPDVDIDSGGDTAGSPPDGVPDINVDDDGDGIPDREIMEIPQWKPDNTIDFNKDLSYGTITIKRKEYLKNEGFVMRNGNGKMFLPIYALKVKDITDEKMTSIQEYTFVDAEEREPIALYEMALLRNEETVPLFMDAVIEVPVAEDIKNPKFYLHNEETDDFMPIEVNHKDGFYSFETSSLGELAILGEIEKEEVEVPILPPKEKEESNENNQIGGALGGSATGDTTNSWMFIVLMFSAGGVLAFMRKRQRDA